MTNTYNTGNPLGSTDARDLYDNASNMDEGMNSGTPSFTDRLGVLRKTWNGLETEFDLAQAGRDTEFQQFLTDSGFTSLGNYAAGLNFTLYNQYMARDGFFYRPGPSSIPFTTTGTWVGGDENLFNLFSADDVLRQDLADSTDSAKGAALVGYSGGTVYSKLGRIRDVIDNGAIGDGVTPDQAAFLSSAANGTVIVPPGVYSIAANTVLDADLIVMRGALIKAEAGITVTVNGSINAPITKIFSGDGSIVFGNQVQIAHPEWFGAGALPYVEGTDFPAIQRCVNACATNEVVTFLGQNYFGSPAGSAVQLSLSTPVASKPGVIINGLLQARAFDFATGNYDGVKFVFPTLTSFETSYIRLKGVNFARIEIESISNGSGAGVVLETVQTTHERCLDNKIDVHIANNIGAVFLFQGGESNTSVLQGNELYCNFALACEYGCLFFIPTVGSTPFWDSNKVVFQAIDGIGVANARGLSNSSDHSVPRLIFRVETWLGGFEPTGVWADGRFDGLDAYIAPASEIPSYGAWSIIGQGNKINQITSGLNIATKSYAVGTTANSRASFNAGAPVTENRFAIIYTVPGGGIAVNAVFALYFYSPYFDSGSNKISAQSINYSGAIAEVVSRGANPNEGVITMRNISGVVIPAGTSIQLYVEVG